MSHGLSKSRYTTFRACDKAIGRYRAIVFRSGMNKAMESFNEYVKDLEPKIKSLTRRLESFLDELTRDVSPGN